MGGLTHDANTRRACLSRTLKGLRRRRGLGSAEMGAALGIARRSYQHFEAGRTEINMDRVHRVAHILDADPYAIIAAIELASPEFAARVADNKMMTIIMMALKDFDLALGDQIAQLDARTLTSTFERAFKELEGHARERAAVAARWVAPIDEAQR
jgi:transcriptional regulator with XRE-family HTH domain